MSLRFPLLVSAAVILLMFAATLYAALHVPAGVLIAVHWNADGKPNGFASARTGLLVLPCLGALLSAIFAVIPRIEPRRFNLERSAKFYRASWIASILLLAVIHVSIVATALGHPLPVTAVVVAGSAGLVMVIGNYLGKSRSVYFAGVRTPWTLTSDYSWERTHRLAGRLCVLTGLAVLVVLALVGAKPALIAFVALITATALVSVAMSYVYWRRDPHRVTGDGAP